MVIPDRKKFVTLGGTRRGHRIECLINARGRIMRPRRFVLGLLSISALALGSPALRAQQPSRLRRVAVLMLYAEKDPEGQARARAFRAGLEKLGWVLGRTIAIDFLWGVFDPDWTRLVT